LAKLKLLHNKQRKLSEEPAVAGEKKTENGCGESRENSGGRDRGKGKGREAAAAAAALQ